MKNPRSSPGETSYHLRGQKRGKKCFIRFCNVLLNYLKSAIFSCFIISWPHDETPVICFELSPRDAENTAFPGIFFILVSKKWHKRGKLNQFYVPYTFIFLFFQLLCNMQIYLACHTAVCMSESPRYRIDINSLFH